MNYYVVIWFMLIVIVLEVYALAYMPNQWFNHPHKCPSEGICVSPGVVACMTSQAKCWMMEGRPPE